jgi:hypothetical protein
MKRIILILLLFSNYVTAQQWQPTSIRQRFVNGIGIPTRDTLPGALSDSSQLVLRPQDSVIYFKYKRYWRALGGQPQLNGTGFVKASGTTISYDNSSYYLASNPNGYTSNLGTVTSVSGTGTVSGLTLSGTVTSSGNLTLGGALSLTSGQVTTALGYTPYNSTNPAGYITSSALSGYLPLSGGTLASSGSSNTLNINHSSGSGIAASITKNGSGEALTVVKGSGSGNAASITGGITLLSELNLTTKLADAHINSAATWNAKQNALNGTGFVKASGTTISYDNSSYYLASNPNGYTSNTGTVTSIATTAPLTGGTITTSGTLGITQATTSTSGFLSSTDWNTFNGKQNAITNPTTGTGTTNYVTKWTGASTLGNSTIFDNGTNVGIGTTSPESGWKFDVAGIATMGSTAGNGRLYISTEGTTNGSTYIQARNLTVATPLHFFSSVNYFEANVGIGTTSPAEKLSVAGRLLVNTNTTDGANALQVNGSAKVSSLAGTGERLVAADASGKLVVSTNITSGYYTPTITLINGIASATASPLMYTNINGIVTVTGKITINSNILTEVNELEINLPASNPNVSPNSVGGCGVEVTASAFRNQDVLNFNSAFNYAKIAITFKSNATGSKVYTFSFSYDSNYLP